MTATDVLTEIRKLTLDEAREVAERLANYLRERERAYSAESGHPFRGIRPPMKA